jgi:hypothetical protein
MDGSDGHIIWCKTIIVTTPKKLFRQFCNTHHQQFMCFISQQLVLIYFPVLEDRSVENDLTIAIFGGMT